MNKLKLHLDELLVESFDTSRAPKRQGTVFGEVCTCAYTCDDATCVYTCDDPSCAESCNGTCAGFTCQESCGGTCWNPRCNPSSICP